MFATFNASKYCCFTNNSVKHQYFVYTLLDDQILPFQTIQFSMSRLLTVWMSNSSIWPIDKNLSGATSPGQSGPGSNRKNRILHIRKIFKGGVSLSVSVMSYPGNSLGGGFWPSSEMQSVYLQLHPTELSNFMGRWLIIFWSSNFRAAEFNK